MKKLSYGMFGGSDHKLIDILNEVLLIDEKPPKRAVKRICKILALHSILIKNLKLITHDEAFEYFWKLYKISLQDHFSEIRNLIHNNLENYDKQTKLRHLVVNMIYKNSKECYKDYYINKIKINRKLSSHQAKTYPVAENNYKKDLNDVNEN